jgi:hypothetical protein
MVTATDIAFHIPSIIGVAPATVQGFKRRLLESGLWPPPSGRAVAKLSTAHVSYLVLAILADRPAKDSAAAAVSYFNLTDPHGNKLGDALTNIIDSFKSVNDVSALTYKSRLEVDCRRPRACLSMKTDAGQNEVLYGVQAEQWSDTRVRRSMTISGKCLFDLACGLHFNRWPEQ